VKHRSWLKAVDSARAALYGLALGRHAVALPWRTGVARTCRHRAHRRRQLGGADRPRGPGNRRHGPHHPDGRSFAAHRFVAPEARLALSPACRLIAVEPLPRQLVAAGASIARDGGRQDCDERRLGLLLDESERLRRSPCTCPCPNTLHWPRRAPPCPTIRRNPRRRPTGRGCGLFDGDEDGVGNARRKARRQPRLALRQWPPGSNEAWQPHGRAAGASCLLTQG
jgi:hypothetical protein